MKSQFLKIAGVKSEKAFYKKFPTEAAFFKAHPEAKKLVNGGEQDKGQLKKLEQLTDFGNPPKANVGDIIPLDAGKAAGKGLGPATSYIGPAMDIIGGIGTLKKEKQQLKQLEKSSKLTDVMLKASKVRPEPIKRQYVRPEDVIVEPNQLASAYGTGTNILAAEDGATIGGNPTEIMNTFAPNTIYTDMGYEPLDDSSQVKQYYKGGKLTKAQLGGEFADKLAGSGFGKFMSNPQAGEFVTNMATRVGGGPSGSSQLGKGIGAAAGTAFLGPVGGIIGGALGSLVGGLFGKKRKKKMERYQKNIDNNVFGMTGQDFSQGLQGEYGSFMKNGGETSEYAWMSHTWQPQVITKFGEYSTKDLLAPDKTMDTLRTGGHIRTNYMFPADQFAMGGELQVYNGEAEPISVNPYLPDGGETVMFRGPSHADGGIPIKYGDSPVEVEGGEPAVKLKNGGTGEEDLVVFGNLIEPKSKRKFKNVVADIAKKENRENKRLDKSINMLDNLDVDTSFDKLTLDSLRANVMGANMKLKNYADEKMDLAAMQNAINETAEEFGLDADALAKDKIAKAKKGANITKGQTGITARPNMLDEVVITATPLQKPVMTSMLPNPFSFGRPNVNLDTTSPTSLGTAFENARPFGGVDENAEMIAGFRSGQRDPFGFGKAFNAFVPGAASDSADSESGKKFNWQDAATFANQLLPILRPSDARSLSTNQIIGELMALSDNAEEPVYAQKFTPRLVTPTRVSFQDRVDDVDKQSRAAILAAGNDPAAQNVIMTQALEAKDRIRSEEFRANQSMFLNAQAQNVDILNRADLQNLQILDTQQERQARAKSITKATKQAAAQSIGNKYAQNLAEQRQLQAYENLYNFRGTGPRGFMQNFNPLAQFNMPTVSGQVPIYDKDGNITGFQQMTSDLNASQATKKTKGSAAKNGSIVKAIKNL
jgi:hypothetical protein